MATTHRPPKLLPPLASPLQATDHARHLVEKCVGKPFFDLPYARGVPRMTQGELDAGLDWVDDRFHLIR